ncbi:hypothetical protein GGI07_003851 [Coemansia sp. Benny D115]|nr:hypothetical protein GGI07_003851 [Coemansia sp. Benny D115]
MRYLANTLIFALAAITITRRAIAAPIDLEQSDSFDIDDIEYDSLDEDDTNILTIKAGFFSYLNSVINELVLDNGMDSSEIGSLADELNSELHDNIVYDTDSMDEVDDEDDETLIVGSDTDDSV